MNRAASIIRLSEARKQNLTGRGVGVAIMDTGIGYHPDLFSNGFSSNSLVYFADYVDQKAEYYDDNGHGTHISGIIAGSGARSGGMYQGVAPGVHLVVLKVLNQNGEGHIDHVLDAISWLLRHHAEYRIRIVNISIGSSRGKHFGEESPLVQGVNKLWEAGLVVLTAAGNHGPSPSSIGAPGNSRKIITVGSSDPLQYRNAKDYSSRGPTDSCIKKPDIVAPGSRITSCCPISYPPKTSRLYQETGYQVRSGTSMSTPIVSGCIALLLERYPYLTNKEIKMHLRDTALDLGFEHTRQGWGLIRCDRFLQPPAAIR